MPDIRDEWRLQAVERKAEESNRRLYEIDSLHSTVNQLENAVRELQSDIKALNSDLEYYKNGINRRFEEIIPEVN